jgi:hypothetical protein
MQIEERVAKLEAEICALKEDVTETKEITKDIQKKLDGYLEHRIKITVESMVGRMLLMIITSSAVVSLFISWLLGTGR